MAGELAVWLYGDCVAMIVAEGKLAEIKARARELDDENQGEHLIEYSTEQAVTVVLHQDPDFLFPRLSGWVHDYEGNSLWDGAEVEPAEDEADSGDSC